MGIRIKNSPDAYDRIFLVQLNISQQAIVQVNDPVTYSVSCTYRRFRVTDDGQIEFAQNATADFIDDYFTLALQELAQGSDQLLNALISNEVAVSRLINLNTGLDTEVVNFIPSSRT